MNGKGSKTRPLSVSYETYADNFDNIFRKKQFTVEVQELSSGDQFIELPDEILKSLNWKEGDEIEWKKESEDSYTAKKVKKK
jgi:hypothetical protein